MPRPVDLDEAVVGRVPERLDHGGSIVRTLETPGVGIDGAEHWGHHDVPSTPGRSMSTRSTMTCSHGDAGTGFLRARRGAA